MRKEVPYFVILDHLLLEFVHFSLKKHSCLFIPCRHYSFFMPSQMFIIIESFFLPFCKKRVHFCGPLLRRPLDFTNPIECCVMSRKTNYATDLSHDLDTNSNLHWSEEGKYEWDLSLPPFHHASFISKWQRQNKKTIS